MTVNDLFMKHGSFFKDAEKRTTALLKRSKAYSKAKLWRAVSAEVDARDGGRCRNCGRAAGGTPETALHRHHIQYRSRLGTDDSKNVITICGRCHAEVHAGRLEVCGDADGAVSWNGVIHRLTIEKGPTILTAVESETDQVEANDENANLQNPAPPALQPVPQRHGGGVRHGTARREGRRDF